MTPWHKLSPAEQAAIAARNHAQLGTAWHENTTPRRDVEKAMDMWRAKAGYDTLGWLPLLGLAGLILLGLLLISSLSGCADMAHRYTRTVWGVDCRQDKLQNGQCVATTSKGAK